MDTAMLSKLLRLVRNDKRVVSFDSFLRTEPVSREFGLDRGTPIDRYYIDAFLGRHAEHVKGVVLEVASSDYTLKFSSDELVRAEVLHKNPNDSNVTLVGDLEDPMSLPANHVDCFICTQTLPFIYSLQPVVDSIWKVLKPGGIFLGTVPGISQISRYDMDRWGDYWRFTTASCERLFAPFAPNISITSYGNVLAAKAFLDGLAIEDLPDHSVLDGADQDYPVTLGIWAQKEDKNV